MKRHSFRGTALLLALPLALTACSPPAAPAALPPPSPRDQVSLYRAPAQAPVSWPTRGWTAAEPSSLGLDAAALHRAVEAVFVRPTPEADRAGVRIDGLVIIYRGHLVAERYAAGYGPDSRHLWWSVAKSLGNAVVGAAVLEGRVHLQDRVSVRDPITLDQALRMSSGLYTSETYEGSPLKSSVNKMLFTTGHRDMGAFAASQALVHPPGTVWEYSSLTPNLVSAWLKGPLGSAYRDYPWTRLLEPLGMASAVLGADPSGTYVFSSYLWATPRDLAKFGFLYLHDGVWEGRRLLPEGWVAYTTTPAPAWLRTPQVPGSAADELGYGAWWWLNRSGPGRGLPWPQVPEDAFAAEGHWGQELIVVPSRSLVIAMSADTRDSGSLDLGSWVASVLASGMTEGQP